MTIEQHRKENFQTFDLGCAATLVTDNFRLVKLDKFNPKKVLFCFEHHEDINKAVENYFSGNFQVDALAFFNALKNLKNRLYST